MRLTSYNMAVKILHAKGCLADMVDRMWSYMEEGDAEKAQCVREKALMMYALLETASKWHPTITEGLQSDIYVGISSVNQPQLTGALAINSISVSYEGVFIVNPDDSIAVSQWAHTVNGFLSENDDIVQVEIVSNTMSGLNALVKTSMSSIVPSGNDSNDLFTINTSAITATTTEFDGVVPDCLTNAQILSVIEKIDDLCECNC